MSPFKPRRSAGRHLHAPSSRLPASNTSRSLGKLLAHRLTATGTLSQSSLSLLYWSSLCKPVRHQDGCRSLTLQHSCPVLTLLLCLLRSFLSEGMITEDWKPGVRRIIPTKVAPFKRPHSEHDISTITPPGDGGLLHHESAELETDLVHEIHCYHTASYSPQ